MSHTLRTARGGKRFVPQRSCLHRQAVFALYRTLLSQCRNLPLEGDDRDALRHVVRHRFRDNRHLRSPLRLTLSFYAGYRALEYLDDASVGCRESSAKITEYLKRVPDELKRPPKPALKPLKVEDPPYLTPPEHKFFNKFPRPTVKGIRVVPKFVRANNFPMVRWKKPQPEGLSRTLRQLHKQKQRGLDNQELYDDVLIPTAMGEDWWDESIMKETNQDSKISLASAMRADHEEISWESVTRAGRKEISYLNRERQQWTMDIAKRMVDIVLAERALAEKERAAREAITSGT